jgi:hypothetical protein
MNSGRHDKLTAGHERVHMLVPKKLAQGRA